MKDKKEILKFVGFIAGAVALFVGFIIGISYFANKSNKVDNTPVVQVQDENGIRLRQNKVAQNTDTLSVTAEVSPADCIDKTVNWSLAWASSNDNDINTYVVITLSTDTLTCTVKVLKEFSTQINLICKSNLDSNVSATCVIDYVSRKFSDTSQSSFMLNVSNGTMICSVYGENIKKYLSYCSLTGGTIAGKIQEDGITVNSFKLNNIDVTEYVFGSKGNLTVNDMIQYLIDNGTTLDRFSSLYFNINFTYKVYYDRNAYLGVSSSTDYWLISSSSTTLSKTINIDVSNFSAASVSLDDSTLLF